MNLKEMKNCIRYIEFDFLKKKTTNNLQHPTKTKQEAVSRRPTQPQTTCVSNTARLTVAPLNRTRYDGCMYIIFMRLEPLRFSFSTARAQRPQGNACAHSKATDHPNFSGN